MNTPATAQPVAAAAAKQQLVADLSLLLPPEAVLHAQEDVKPYECDGLAVYRQTPMVVVLPSQEYEVAAILKRCHELRVPVVARGTGTALSGGATPLGDGVLLSLARFSRILSVDPLVRTARVQPGVRNLAVSEAVAQYGLYYAPDPSSQIACSIGGNVAENSGGVHCLKYGLTVHNVLKLKVITIEGDVLEIGAESLDSAGYDLLALMTGSEGLLGVVTEVTLKLLPNPPGELERTEALGAEILELCVAVGGTITGEHGVGIEKINQMCVQFKPKELAVFHGIKQVFDEYALLNPGKAVPTLHHCVEFGRMHIHHGELPRPDLRRF